MYPYLDFFNEPDVEGIEFLNDLNAENEDLRSHLNAHMESNRTRPEVVPQPDPVNIIH